MGGDCDPAIRWPLETAWEAVVEVTAPTFGLAPDLLRAKSRGRGPRPPKAAWEAKKMAVHLAVMLSGCDYAALGRHIGLHRDTVASHCAAMRGACADDATMEVRSDGLLLAAATRLASPQPEPFCPLEEKLTLAMLLGRLQQLERQVLTGAAAQLHPTNAKSSDSPAKSRKREISPGTIRSAA